MPTRFLMWVHYTYTLLLPSLACIGAVIVLEKDASHSIVVSILPLFFYIYIYSVLYKTPDSVPHLLVLLATTPALVAVDTLVFGDTVWHFFIESTAIEVGSFGLGVGVITLRHAAKKREPGCAVLGVVFAGATVYGLMWPILAVRMQEHPAWCLLFFINLGAALAGYVGSGGAPESDDEGVLSRDIMVWDGGWLARRIAGNPPEARIGPKVPEPIMPIVFMVFLLASPLLGVVIARFVYKIYF